MTLRNVVALICLSVCALSEIGLGLVYVTASKPMPYHEEALGIEWSQVQPGSQAVLRTLLNGYGSTHLAVGLALAVLLWALLRRGLSWARWAILAVGLPVFGGTAFFSHRLATLTGAQVPWPGALTLLLVFLSGVVLVGPHRQTLR
ncbi:MAG: hypothetical protein JNG86_05185 [Verrucomicrobiaceae bacterium]|nr:hypothetical protein [Verrucomicrobiaceae bacterium]